MPIWIIPSAPEAASSDVVVSSTAGTIDHVTAAINRLPLQFRKPRIEALVRALVTPIQSVENAFMDLLTERTVDTAVGTQLDAIGSIVGQTRQGYLDDDYRRLVRARIATNRSRGTFEDLLNITRLVIDDPTATLVIQRSNHATVLLRIDGVIITEDVATILIGFLRQAKAGGVRIILKSGTTAAAGWFTWGVTGLGFCSVADPTSGGKLISARE